MSSNLNAVLDAIDHQLGVARSALRTASARRHLLAAECELGTASTVSALAVERVLDRAFAEIDLFEAAVIEAEGTFGTPNQSWNDLEREMRSQGKAILADHARLLNQIRRTHPKGREGGR